MKDDLSSSLSKAWRMGDDEGAEWALKEAEMNVRGSHGLCVKRLDHRATLPTRGTPRSAGIDLYAIEENRVFPGDQVSIRTGIAMAIPDGYVGLIWPRSSLAVKYGVTVEAGVIDSDYRGEVTVLLRNNTKNLALTFNAGDRVAQMVIQAYSTLPAVEVDDLPDTERGAGGFGSTGR